MTSSSRTGRMPALLGATALATSLLIGGAALAQEPKRGGTLIVGLDSEADFLDNQAAGGWSPGASTRTCSMPCGPRI